MIILRLVKILFLCLVAAGLVLLFFANNEPVTLHLLPDQIADALGVRNEYTISLFFVVVATLILGIVVGFVWEWLREYRYRSEMRTHKREASRLSNEVAQMKGKTSDSQDDILAIVDNANAAR